MRRLESVDSEKKMAKKSNEGKPNETEHECLATEDPWKIRQKGA